MKPLFPFYGSKWRDAKRYAQPHNGVVVEPFAGSAGYSTYWAPKRVHLFDVDPIIVGVWDYLIRVAAAEVLALPDLEVGQSVDDFPALPQEARWLIGFWLNRGSAQPKKTKTAFSARTERAQLVWSERARVRIAADLDGIREWTITHGSYETCGVGEATWFVDPPYGDKGRYYRFRNVDYEHLGAWCRTRPGQVIACEQVGATWLPFEPLAVIKSTRGTSAEAVWHRPAASGERCRARVPLPLRGRRRDRPREWRPHSCPRDARPAGRISGPHAGAPRGDRPPHVTRCAFPASRVHCKQPHHIPDPRHRASLTARPAVEEALSVMPTRPLRPCSSPRCPALTSAGRCDAHARATRQQQDERRGTAAERGYDGKWRKAREAFLAANPLCRLCAAEGRTTGATVVDHIVPHKGDMAAFWKRNNWQSLCASCHSAKTAREDGGFGRQVTAR